MDYVRVIVIVDKVLEEDVQVLISGFLALVLEVYL